MKFTTIIATALPFTALPFAEAASAVWDITNFEAYDYAHTWSSHVSFNITPSTGAAPVACFNETASGIAYLANTTGTACSDPAFTFDVTYFFDYWAYTDPSNGQPVGANLTLHHQAGDARQTASYLLDDIFFTYTQSGRSCDLCRSVKWDGDQSFAVTAVDD